MTEAPLPAIVTWLLSALPVEWRDSIEGDLVEERERRRRAGRSHGVLWTTIAAAQVAGQLGCERFGHRDHRGGNQRRRSVIMQGFISDLRQSGRRLVAQKGFTLVAVLTLALGIGANTAVFNLANWLLLRPVPGVHAIDELVSIGFGTPGGSRGPIAYPDFVTLDAGVPAFSDLAGFQTFDLHVAPASVEPRRVQVDVVTARFFEMLGAPVRLGRSFTDDESESPAASPAAVISDRLWRRDLGGGPDAIGKSLAINGHPFTVIGVTVPGFHGPTRTGATDVWLPLAQHRQALPMYRDNLLRDREARVLFGLVGRLAPGATIDAVVSQAEAVRASLAAANPSDRRMQNWRFIAQPGIEARPWVRDRIGRSMTLLLGIVGLLLILTCANVANLLLARATALRGEVATRRALGATRWRVTRLLLTESLLLSVAAGLASLALSWAVSRLLQGTSILQGLPPLDRAQADGAVFVFALSVSTVVAVGAGLLPAIAGGRVDLTDALRDSARSMTAARRRIRRALTIAQVAVSLTLLIGAGLLTRSMAARLAIDPGFDPSKVLSVSVEPGLQGNGPRQDVFYRDLVTRARQLPGIRGAGLAWLRPYSQGAADTAFKASGGNGAEISAPSNMISPGYFAALGLTLVAGREFIDAEFQRQDVGGGGVVILTESLANRTFPEGPAVGRQIVMEYPEGRVRTVVGVVRDTRQRQILRDSGDMYFEPFGQTFPSGWASLVVGLDAPAEVVADRLRSLVREIDGTLPVYDVAPLDVAIRQQFADDFLVMRLALTFAVLATIVAAVGLYGVLARSLAEQRREFAIRSALGAAPSRVAGHLTREAATMLAMGLAIGLPASIWLARFIDSRVFGISRLDPLAFAAATLVLALAMLGASIPAARRAARLDPAEVLRN